MVKDKDFNSEVELPIGLTVAAIRKSVEFIEREAKDLVELYLSRPMSLVQ